MRNGEYFLTQRRKDAKKNKDGIFFDGITGWTGFGESRLNHLVYPVILSKFRIPKSEIAAVL